MWRQQLLDHHPFFKLSATRLIYQELRVITGDDTRLSLIICRVFVKWKTAKCFFKIKMSKRRQKASKYAAATPTSSDISIGTNCTHSLSRDTIPLSCSFVKYLLRAFCPLLRPQTPLPDARVFYSHLTNGKFGFIFPANLFKNSAFVTLSNYKAFTMFATLSK
jgi:hypothetical protein